MEEYKSEWISVKDKLPEKDGWYLVTLGHVFDTEKPYNGYGKIVKGKELKDYQVVLSKFTDGKWKHGMVAAWMPKPKPYTGDEEEQDIYIYHDAFDNEHILSFKC